MSSNANTNSKSGSEPRRQELAAFLEEAPGGGAAAPAPAQPQVPQVPPLPVTIHFRRRIRKGDVGAVLQEFEQLIKRTGADIPAGDTRYTLRRSHIGGYVHLIMKGNLAFVNRFIELAWASGWRPYGNIEISEVVGIKPIPRHGEEEFSEENYTSGHSNMARKHEMGGAAPPVQGVDDMTAAVYRRTQSSSRYGGLPYATTAAAVRGATMAEGESPNVGPSPPRVPGESDADYKQRKKSAMWAEEMLRRREAAARAYKVGGGRRTYRRRRVHKRHTQKRRM